MGKTPRECFKLWILGWIELACSVIRLATLGVYEPKWRMKALLCEWFDS